MEAHFWMIFRYVVFVLWAGCCVDSCSACRATGESVLRCIFGWLLATPKLYHHDGRRSWPQDGSNAAVRQPTWRLFFARASLWLSCKATGESILSCIFGWLLAMPKLYHHCGLQGRRSWPQDGSNAAVRQPTWRLFFRACMAMVELQGPWGERLEVYFWMAFRNAEIVSPLWAPR